MTTSTALCVSNGTSLVKKVEKTPTRQTIEKILGHN